MLTIQQEQIEAMQKMRERDFQERLARHLKLIYPTLVPGDVDLETLIYWNIARASEYEVVTEADIARYLEYVIFFGEQFDTDPDLPWIHEILADDNLDGTKKMDLIDIQLPAYGF